MEIRSEEEVNMIRTHPKGIYLLKPRWDCVDYSSNINYFKLSSSLSSVGLLMLIILLQIGTSLTIPISLISSQEKQSSNQDGRRVKDGAARNSTLEPSFFDSDDSIVTVFNTTGKTDDYESLLHVTSSLVGKSKEENFTGSSSIVKRASGSNKAPRNLDSLMSFGQLIILAQEEAKCLLHFGSQKSKTGYGFSSASFEDGLYAPFTCQSSSYYAQCERCKTLTDRSRNPEECKSYCEAGHELTLCMDLCLSINKAISERQNITDQKQLQSTKSNSENKESIASEKSLFFNSTNSPSHITTMKSELYFNSSSTYPASSFTEVDWRNPLLTTSRILPNFLHNPQIFCEGVDRVETMGKPHSKLSTPVESSLQGSFSQEDSTNDTEGKHFVVLKWNLNYDNLVEPSRRNWSASTSTPRKGKTTKPLSRNINGRKTEELPIVFVVEKYSKGSTAWETVGKTVQGLYTMNVAYLSESYRWRITAVSPEGVVDQATTEDYVTLPGYVHPGPPKKIYVVQTTVSNYSVNALIGWDPPEDRTCFYRVILERPDGKEVNVRVNEPLGAHRWWFDNLNFGTQYSLLITSRDASYNQNYQSSLTRFDFTTPTCLESYSFRFDKCVPTPPREITSEIQVSSADAKNVGVVLKWKPPQNTSATNQIVKYVVTINRLNFKNNGGGGTGITGPANAPNGMPPSPDFNGSFFNPEKLRTLAFPSNATRPSYDLPGNKTSVLLNNLLTDAQYTVMITAFSVRGPSPPAEHHLFTKLGGKEEQYPGLLGSGLWVFFTVPLCLVMFILVICHLGRNYLQKRKVKLARDQYFQSMEERDTMAGDWSIVPLTEETSTWKLFNDNFSKERWEIQYENLIMAEVIGQGAFGVVRRAKIPRKKLQSSTLKFLDKSCQRSYDSHMECDKEDEMETVAVKMLKVSATREDQEQLIKEIMTMQNLGFHSQIVGLIGACTKGRSLCLVLEYCPGGDLLTFIRKVRAKYWPTLGLSDARKSNSVSSNASKENTTSSVTRSNPSCGSRGKQSFGEEPLDSSPINYADIEGVSDYSSNNEDLGDVEETCEQSKLCRDKSPQRSPSRRSASSSLQEDEEDHFRPIDEKDVLSYARQIAMGMDYLEKNRIVHRDLACRNCLLMGDHRQIKISDFGLSRDIYTWNVYHQKSNGKLPIKWMAIESIFTHVFTTKSDVWSYGILLWELVTLGGTPYPGLGNNELFHLLKSGYRMERPDNCSEELYAVMKKCWRTSPAARPNFTELRHHVETMMEAAEPNLYLSLKADIPSDYFRLSSRSDLLQMHGEATEGSMGVPERSKEGHYSGNSSTRRIYSKKHRDYSSASTILPSQHNSLNHNFPSGNPYSSLTNPSITESSKYAESIKPYTRSNSTVTTSNSCSSSSNGPSRTNSVHGSTNNADANATLPNFILGAVPKRSKHSHSASNTHQMNRANSSNCTLMEVSEMFYAEERSESISSPRQDEGERESSKSTNVVNAGSGMAVCCEPGEFPVVESCTLSPTTIGEYDDDCCVNKDEHASTSQTDCQPVDPLSHSRKELNYNASGLKKKSITSPGSSNYFGDSVSAKQSHTHFFPNTGSICRSSSVTSNSPTSPAGLPMKQLPYPFRHVNDMTIIENKTYDLKD